MIFMHFLRVAYNPAEKLCMSRLLAILSCRLSAEHVASTRCGIRHLINNVVQENKNNRDDARPLRTCLLGRLLVLQSRKRNQLS